MQDEIMPFFKEEDAAFSAIHCCAAPNPLSGVRV
jgi:hypothetical protein